MINGVLAASGGQSDNFAFNGALVANLVTHTTLAQIENGAVIDVGFGLAEDPDDEETDPERNGAVVVNASDIVYAIEIVGGVAVSDHIGVGASAVVNVINRDTNAVIGSLLDDASADVRGLFTSDGDVRVGAHTGGFVGALAISGSKTSKGEEPKSSSPSGGTWGTSGSDGTPQSNADIAAWQAKASQVLAENKALENVSDNASQSGDSQWGLSISGAVTVNVVAENTRAYVHETGDFNVTNGIAA